MPSATNIGARAARAVKKPFKRVAQKFARTEDFEEDPVYHHEDAEPEYVRPDTRLAAKKLKELENEISTTTGLLSEADRLYTNAQKRYHETQQRQKQKQTLFQQAQSTKKLNDFKDAVAGHTTKLQELEKKRKKQQTRLDELMKLEPQGFEGPSHQDNVPKRGEGEDRLARLAALSAKAQPLSYSKETAPASPPAQGIKRKIAKDEANEQPTKKRRAVLAPEDHTALHTSIRSQQGLEPSKRKNDVSDTVTTTPHNGSADSHIAPLRKQKPACESKAADKIARISQKTKQVKSAVTNSSSQVLKKPLAAVSNAVPPTSNPAPKATTKRKRDDDRIDFEGDGYDDPSETDEPTHAQKRPKLSPEAPATGLSNIENACFSNVALQLLNAALTIDDTKLLSSDHEPQDFSVDLTGTKDFDGLPESRKKIDEVLSELRKSIEIATAQGDLRIAPFVRALIEDIRKSKDEYVSPLLLQQVFAHHHKAYQRFNGDTMQDASEYLQLLLDTLFEECPALRALFQHQVHTTFDCNDCQNHETREAHAETIFKIRAPSSATCSLQDTLNQHFQSKQDPAKKCGKCDRSGSMEASEEIDPKTMPSNLLVEISRVRDDATTNTTRLQIDSQDIFIGGLAYRVKAIVKHDCRKAASGHYFVWREYRGEWLKIDDELVVHRKRASEMEDGAGRKAAYTSLVLLKRKDTIV
ncbi:hypothetical protein HII31_01598 [Pseudocercospora fuligena]|uniref:USP domain-containing protein n=1 Tax=Pseudocercospora fuligena TaxID=685502 RepID=A0A8H6VLV4_9PEZI|nr:hypothetical protein HII31_01598 [Pseudocercospora fuligena]